MWNGKDKNLKCFCLLHLWVAYTDGFFGTSIWEMVAGIFCVLSYCFLLGILHLFGMSMWDMAADMLGLLFFLAFL